MVIALGAAIILIRTFLGIPGSWQTVLLVLCGAGLMIVGFLLRGEAISRSGASRRTGARSESYTFVESAPTPENSAHEQREGITSLN